MTSNQELYQKILKNHKCLVKYYPYRTGDGGENIISTNSLHKDCDYELKNIVDLMIGLGSALAGNTVRDNKCAVEVIVDGIDFPIYFVFFDFRYYITREIISENEGKNIHWDLI